MNRNVAILVVALASILIGNTPVYGKPISKPSQKHIDVRPTRWMAVGKLTGGMLVGEAADAVDEFNGTFKDKVVYGVGFGLEYAVGEKWLVGPIVEYDWKIEAEASMEAIRATSYGASVLYRFSPGQASTYTLRCEPGYMLVGDDSYPYIRIGAGSLFYTSSTVALRAEVYYKHGFGSDGDSSTTTTPDYTDVAYFGISLDFSVGF
ncbi:MAG: hypothetical protein ABIE70_07215 [bacterium]